MRVTRAMYHRMAEAGLFEGLAVELVEGEVIVMPPMGEEHARPVQELNALLVRALPPQLRVRPQLPLAPDDENEPQPDFAVVPESAGEDGETPPAALLVIEIASTSLAFDLKAKAQLYARAGIPEYWVLDVKKRELVVHRSPATTRYRSVRRLHDLSHVTSAAVPGLTLDLRRVFVRR